MNEILHRAKKARNDEFYTLYSDIEKEMSLHKEHFKNKIVYCPCDDYEKSEFVHFFLDHFDSFELKGLIATSYAYAGDVERDLFNSEIKKGKILVKTFDDVHYGFLEGTGDFRSKECTAFRDKCDIIATNPPFSLYREFFTWANGKDLELVSPINCVKYKDCFSSFKSRKVILGERVDEFRVAENLNKRASAIWVSTFDYNIPPLTLTESYSPKKYPKYDNYDAIEVSKTLDIPKDYKGTMGVPITFLEKWDPSQFDIVGLANRGAGDPALKTKVYTESDCSNYSSLNSAPVLIDKKGKYHLLFARLLIRRKIA